MPATIVIDRGKRVVYSAFHGEVSEREFLEHGPRIEAQPSFDTNYAEIVDLSGVTNVEVSLESLKALAGRRSIFSSSAKHVVVAPPGSIAKLARLFQALAAVAPQLRRGQ